MEDRQFPEFLAITLDPRWRHRLWKARNWPSRPRITKARSPTKSQVTKSPTSGRSFWWQINCQWRRNSKSFSSWRSSELKKLQAGRPLRSHWFGISNRWFSRKLIILCIEKKHSVFLGGLKEKSYCHTNFLMGFSFNFWFLRKIKSFELLPARS